MSWYVAEDQPRNVREVVVDAPNPRPVNTKFGMLMLGPKLNRSGVPGGCVA
jgi:hypothetical protein